MKSFAAKIVHLSASRPRAVLAAWVIVLLAALTAVGQLKLLGNIDEIGGEDFPSVSFAREMQSVFPAGTSLFLMFQRADGTPLVDGDLCALKRVVTGTVLRSDVVKGVVSPLHVRDIVTYPTRVVLEDWVRHPCEPGAVERYIELAASSPWARLFLGERPAGNKLQDVFVEMSFDVPTERLASDRAPLPFETTLAIVREELEAHAPNLSVVAAGPAAFQMSFKSALEADMLLNLAGFVVIALLVRMVLGTWRASVVLMASLGVLGALVFGSLAALRIPIDPLNNALLLMVSIAGVQDYLFVGLSRTESSNLVEKFAKTSHASLLTSLTTALGFGALAFSDLNVIREFGLVAAVAALVEWLLMFTAIPAAARLGWIGKEHMEPRPSRFAGRLGKWFDCPIPRSIALLAIGVFALGVASISRLELNDNLKLFFEESHPFRTSIANLSDKRGFEGSVSLETNLIDRDAVHAVYERISRIEGVAGVINPASIIDYLVRGEKTDADLGAVEATYLRAPQLAPWFKSRDHASGTVFVKDTELKSLARILPQVREACGNVCKPYGSLVSYEEYSSAILPSLMRSLSASFLFVSLTLAWLAWRSGQLRRLPQILFGSFWGPVVLIGLFVLLDLPINFATSIFGSVLVGITGDNCIQYLLGDEDHGMSLESGVAAKGIASFMASLALVCIAALFVASNFQHMRHLGLLFAAGFALSFVGDVWVSKMRWRKGAAA
jgi:predicted RND superfamily exporter protein